MPSTLSRIAAVLGVALGLSIMTGGMMVGITGYSQYDSCGSVDITVTDVPAGQIESTDEYTDFETLSADQRATFERALETGDARLENRTGFPKIAYQDGYYRTSGSVVVCDFDPELIMGVGGVAVLLGLLPVTVVARRLFADDHDEET